MRKIIIILFLQLSVLSFADNANDIMFKNDKLKSSENSRNITTMVLINKKGNKKVRKMEILSMDTDLGENQFLEFILPADVKGTKFLILGNDKGDDEQRLFLPALNKIRKISSSKKNGKFMGSDITYYDMENKNLEEYSYEILEEVLLNGIECWVIISTPKADDTPYSKVHSYISKDNYFSYKREIFGKKGKHIKTITVLEISTIDGVIIPVKTVIDNLKDEHKTLLSVNEITINEGVDKSTFTVQNLK